MNLQSILDTTAKRFDERFPNVGCDERDFEGLIEKSALKQFIHAAQLEVLEAVREQAVRLKKYVPMGYDEISPIQDPKMHMDVSYNQALADFLSALDLDKEQV